MQTMGRFDSWLVELIQENGGVYVTPNGIELIAIEKEESIYIGCKYPGAIVKGSPEVLLEVIREFPDIITFSMVFPIQHLTDLDYLTPESLFLLYATGTMSVSACASERGAEWHLCFKMKNGDTVITDKLTEETIYNSVRLTTCEEIISFTRAYIAKCPPRLTARMANKIRRQGHL
jgi:hypothetical protein